MTPNRDAQGRFENHLNVGSTMEQTRAGVGAADNEWTAAAKVGRQRTQEAAAEAARLGDPLYADALRQVNARARRRAWVGLLVLAVLGVIGWAWWATAVATGPTHQPFTARHGRSTVSVLPPAMLASARAEALRGLAHLFRPEAPLDRLFDGCAAQPCTVPDLAALDAFRRWAADNQTPWDEQLCLYFTSRHSGLAPGQQRSHLGVVPTWRMDRARSECVVTNRGAFAQRAAWLNTARHVVAGLLALAVLAWFRRWVARLG